MATHLSRVIVLLAALVVGIATANSTSAAQEQLASSTNTRVAGLIAIFFGTIITWISESRTTQLEKKRSEIDVVRVTEELTPVISKLASDAADNVSKREADAFGLGCAAALLRVMDGAQSSSIRSCIYRYDLLTDGSEDSGDGSNHDRLVRVGLSAGRATGLNPRESFSSDNAFEKDFIEKLKDGGHIQYDDLKHLARKKDHIINSDDRYAGAARSRSYRSCVSVPVKDEKGYLLGMISCDSENPYAFTATDVKLMSTFAGLVGAGFTIMSTAPTVRKPASRTERGDHALSS